MAETANHVEQQDRETPWHSLEADEVLERLDTGPDGLDAAVAAQRLEQYGPNELAEDEPPSSLAILLHQFRSPLITILLVAAAVTVAIREYIDTGVIAAVLVINATIGFIQERKADRSVRALMQLAAPKSTVVRDGATSEVESTTLVPGDIVVLESGTRVPADLRVAKATALRVDESLLTGESVPVDKRADPVEEKAQVADRESMAHMGSVVASGRGRGVVVATAAATQLGAIAESIREVKPPRSPLQARMDRFANIIAAAVLSAAAAAFGLGLAVGHAPSEMFLTAVALAVAIVPEGLPVAFTVAMALGVNRMARRNAIIRTLPAVETLGSTDTIGSDKTGTLTENRMTVQRIWTANGLWALRPEDADEDAQHLVADDADVVVRSLLATGALTNEARFERDAGEPQVGGDPTEAALLLAAFHLGVDPAELREEHGLVADMPFESDLQYSATARDHDGRQTLHVKGAPERVLGMCAEMATPDGPKPVDEEAVHAAASDLAERGLRVLAMASKELGDPLPEGADIPEPEGLWLLGLQGMLDPPREGVAEAVAGCQEAGIRVVMITGDHAKTASAIARRIGIDEEGDVLTGADVGDLDDEELAERVGQVSVYARVSPDHKHRIVRALRSHGGVTAVTGDGVNDAPALKAADIGIAMGRSGTDVAREASDMVLTDDNFISIYAAVEEGRVVFDNVRKVTYFLVSTGVAAIVAVLYSLVAGWPLPFLPAQLLWLNVVTNGLQDVALAFEPGEKDVLRRPPRSRRAPVVSRLLWERTALTGTTMAIGALYLFDWALATTGSETRARSVALTTLVVFMAFHVYNARSENQSLFRMNPLRNPFLLGSTLLALTIHAGALYWGPTQFVLRVEPIDPQTWLRIVVVALSVIAVSELHKRFRGRVAPGG